MSTQPNILFILTDQMRPDELGPATPNLNRLATQGFSFHNCYCASPLCQPSRNCMITGKFPSQNGVVGNMNPPISEAERQDTYANHLREAGYHTAYIGKHHYFDRFNMGMDVTEDDDAIKGYGYDYLHQVVDIMEGKHNGDRFTRYLADKGKLETYRKNLNKDYFESLPREETPDGYIADQGVDYLQNYDKDAPLMLTVGLVGPHPPHWTPKEYTDLYSSDDVPAPKGLEDPDAVRRYLSMRATYRAQVKQIDDEVGRLVETLEERGMRDNTMIAFIADHGHTIGDYGVHDKRFFYEQSVRVPFILSGACVPFNPREPEKESNLLVSSVDLYPTFLDAAGCENILGNDPAKRQGKSLLRLLNNEEPPRRYVCSELGTAMMVRDANWKLMYDPEQGGTQQLFNFRRDAEELDNLAGLPGYENIEHELTGSLLDHMIQSTRFTHIKERKRVQRVQV